MKRKKARTAGFSGAYFRDGARMDGITGFRSFPAVLSSKFRRGPDGGGSGSRDLNGLRPPQQPGSRHPYYLAIEK